MEERLQLLNDFWSKQGEIELISSFQTIDDSFCGEIKLISPPKEDLIFEAKIPISYPFSNDTMSIRFCCKNKKGYKHMNADNSICIIVPKNVDFIARLKDEVILLKEWRDKYYIQELNDGRYEYPIVKESYNDTFLFTDTQKKFIPLSHGMFYACPKNYIHRNSGVFFVQRFDNTYCQWNDWLKSEVNVFGGLYFFINREPVTGNGRIAIENWEELEGLISQQGKEFLYKIKTLDAKNKPSSGFILLGYPIPNSEEIHWLALKIETKNIPIKGRRIGPRNYIYEFYSSEIKWCKTHNISYNRFFGRGALNSSFADKKILIVGCGAIGSSLAKILVRGGAKNIALCDIENVEPGNICRSEFILNDISVPKSIALVEALTKISPFVNIQIENTIDKSLFAPHIESSKKNLEKYDLIFDCTSDMELLYVLDQLNLNTEVFNMSLSNKANELVCVAKSKNMAKEKSQLFSKLSVKEEKLFYEGTGCWSPTFEASYYDINCLLNLVVKNINLRFERKIAFNSFIIKAEQINSSLKLDIIDY